ncbi:MAG TPA: hypothetical protein VNN73_08915 [Blastocatellia bacterium]|nr:hypothetical protein [Blastocatellia bacterium]
MFNGVVRNRGELAKAESTLQELEEKYERVRSLLEERKAERLQIETQVQAAAAAAGDMDRLVALQSRAVALDRSIAELSAAEAECCERVQSARRYLYTLYVRLEKLRQEAVLLKRKLWLNEEAEALSGEERASLSRLKIQIKAITGESQTGQLI